MFQREPKEDGWWLVGSILCPNETVAIIVENYLNKKITYKEFENKLNDQKLAYELELEIKKQAKKLYPPTKGKGR